MIAADKKSGMDKLQLQNAFCEQVKGFQLQSLFDYLPDVYFVVKNYDGRVMMANDVAVQLCGFTREMDMIGKCDHDIFDKERADAYVTDDRSVLETGERIVDRVELAPDPDSAINWFLTTKIPLFSNEGSVIGLACIARNVNAASDKLRPYSEMNEVLEYIRENYAGSIRTEDLARIAHLSPGAFERKFRKTFGITPVRHITNVRIRAACSLLTTTNLTIATIAQESGFYDHSHLTRTFKKIIGISPGEYRGQSSSSEIINRPKMVLGQHR